MSRSGKPDPKCPKCEGKGSIVTSGGLLQLKDIPGAWPETWRTRCPCTDAPRALDRLTGAAPK